MPAKKTYYGVSVGILMVKSTFRRYHGDVGNAQTFDFPVQYRIVEDAVPSRMTELHSSSLLEPFKKAADELIEAGVDGITTTCGFLSIYQRELADHCSVPVASSSLLQVPMVERMLPTGKRVGILTYNGEVLNGPYLDAVGIAQDTPVVGLPRSSNFVRWIKEGDNSVTFDTLREEVVAAAERMVAENPDVGAIVNECTNLAPFTRDIHERLGVPVFDVITMINAFHAAICPPRYRNDD